MSESENRIVEVASKALDRVATKILSLQDAYIIVLKSKTIAMEGLDETLSEAYSSMDERLKSIELDSQKYFMSILFIDLVSEIEIFLSYMIKVVTQHYPKKLNDVSYKLSEIVDMPSVDELVTRAAGEYINKLMYKKPYEYLESICKVLSIEREPLEEYWPVYVEAKCRRDLGVHNGWVCNATYLRKLSEAGIKTEVKEGDILLPEYRNYVHPVIAGIISIIDNVTQQIIVKYK